MPSPISPVAPARVQALLLPAGRIRKQRFQSYVDRLRRDAIVRLGDISPDSSFEKNLFSPIAFPDGVILYDFVTTVPPDSHLQLYPYETFRSPFIVIGVVDARDGDLSSEALTGYRDGLEDFARNFPCTILQHLVIFDAPSDANETLSLEGVLCVPFASESQNSNVKTLLCDLSSAFLTELSSFAQEILSLQQIESPKTRPTSKQQDLHRHNSARTDVSRRDSLPAIMASSQADSNAASASPQSLTKGGNSIVSRTDTSPPELSRTASLTVNGTSGRPLSSSRSNLAMSRDGSRERRPIQPANFTSMTARTRNRLRARQGVIMGTLYLHAGRWADALRELNDSTTRAKALSDHVWHAKGLENLVSTMILMTWAGIDFSTPAICLPNHERAIGRPRAFSGGSGSVETANANQTKGLQTLSSMIPDLVHVIMSTYACASNLPGEALPQLPFSQSAIRLAYLLTLLCNSGGKLDGTSLRLAVNGGPSSKHPLPKLSTLSQGSKREIAALVYRAYPEGDSAAMLSHSDRALILTSMASILALGGLHRKQAMFVKETLEILIPGLIQARKVGAAEIGIHPAAGLAALHGLHQDSQGGLASIVTDDPQHGFHSLLEQLAKSFGALTDSFGETGLGKASQRPAEASLPKAADELILRSFGNSSLKSEILRLCTNFSEALPNFKDVVHFAGALLLAAGPVSSSNSRLTSTIRLSREEQARLSVKISRTLAVVRSTDAPQLETQYWDPFLVQDVGLGDVSEADAVVSHAKSFMDDISVLPIQSDGRRGPPLLVPPPRNALAEDVVVSGDHTRIAVTLQNPYEFELIIERLSLSCSGLEVRQQPASLVIGPRRYQTFSLSIFAQSVGKISIDGCIVKVQGCREALFKVHKRRQSTRTESKIKHFGLDNLKPPTDDDLQSSSDHAERRSSESDTKIFNSMAIRQQPLLTVAANTLSQSIITILEGETQRFSITVRNASSTIPVTFARLTFSHPARESQMDTSKGLFGRTELHELEWLALHRQPFSWHRPIDEDISIAPGASKTFHADVFGRMGIMGGMAVLDYAHVDNAAPSPGARIFTRTISLPFSVTVSPSVLLQRIDVLPVTLPILSAVSAEHSAPNAESLEHQSYLLLLDLKNASAHPLSVTLSSKSASSSSSTEATIQPSHTTRISLSLPRLLLPHVEAPIPPLAYLKERQFVVSREGPRPSPAAEKEVLANYWTRLALLDALTARWRSLETPKSGEVDLRGLKLEGSMGRIIRLDPMAISISVDEREGSAARTEQPVKAIIKLHNRAGRKVSGVARFSVGLAREGSEIGKNVIYQGKQETWFRDLEEGAEVQTKVIVCVLVTGRWEIRIRVEERDGGLLGTAKRPFRVV